MKTRYGILFLNLVLLGHFSISYADPIKRGPCSGKLLSEQGQAAVTEEFKMYLEMLLEASPPVITLDDLTPFIQKLSEGKIMNPIPSSSSNKSFELHHSEFEKLVSTHSVGLEEMRMWVKNYFLAHSERLEQKQKAESETKDAPFVVTTKGAMLFKLKHPKLGDVIKILKPGGNKNNPLDYDAHIWAMNALPGKRTNEGYNLWNPKEFFGIGKDSLYSMTRHGLVPKNSHARKACIDLGGDLPTLKDFERLREYFDLIIDPTTDRKDIAVQLTPQSVGEFRQAFGSDSSWTATVREDYRENAYVFYPGRATFLDYSRSYDSNFVRCIAPNPTKRSALDHLIRLFK